MEIEFDPAKDAENRRRHGISLDAGALVIVEAVGEVVDARKDYGETRVRAFAEIDGRWLACVYTMRGNVARIISVHRVRSKEVRRWLGANWSA